MLEHTVYDHRFGPAAERLADGLRAAARRRFAGARGDARRGADRSQPARRQGSGQAGCIAAPQTDRCNAILDALVPLGIEQSTCRPPPRRIWKALHLDQQKASNGQRIMAGILFMCGAGLLFPVMSGFAQVPRRGRLQLAAGTSRRAAPSATSCS